MGGINIDYAYKCIEFARMWLVISKTAPSSGTNGVVGRHYQPSSTWPGSVEIAPAYRATEDRAMCALARGLSSLCCEIQRRKNERQSRDGREAVGAGAANRENWQREEGRTAVSRAREHASYDCS